MSEKKRRRVRGGDQPLPKPGPLLGGLLLCDQVIHDSLTGKWSVIGMFNSFRLPAFPHAVGSFVVFGQLVDGIGRYSINLEMIDLSTGKVMGGGGIEVDFPRRMQPAILMQRIPGFVILHPGKYDIVLSTQAGEVARCALEAVHVPRPRETA